MIATIIYAFAIYSTNCHEILYNCCSLQEKIVHRRSTFVERKQISDDIKERMSILKIDWLSKINNPSYIKKKFKCYMTRGTIKAVNYLNSIKEKLRALHN